MFGTQDLIQDGLYKTLALASYPPPFHHVSSCLIARALGATDPKARTVRRELARTKNGLSKSLKRLPTLPQSFKKLPVGSPKPTSTTTDATAA